MLLNDYLDRGAVIDPDGECLISPDGGVLMTHAQLREASHRIARGLLDAGIRPGDRVAVYAPNDPKALACLLGVIRAGAIWTAVNASSSVEDIAAFLELTECRGLVYHAALAEPANALAAQLPAIEVVAAIGQGGDGHLSVATWLDTAGDPVATQRTADDVAVLTGTGGTTGRPKAVPITHRQLLTMCLAFNAGLAEGRPPRYVCATPMTHAAGALTFPVIAEGGAVIVHNGVDPHAILDSIEWNRASRVFLPPTALYALMAQPDLAQRDFSSLRNFIVGAAPIAPERLAEAVAIFGPVMAQAFGQTEAPMICTLLTAAEIAEAADKPELRHRLAACGRPSLVAEVAIMGEDGQLLGPEESGEVVVRSDLVFGGYWNNEAASEETRRPGGWHGTGDVGRRDRDGFIYIVDRLKDMIITGGFNVFPSEVEAVIHTLGFVNDCSVIGIPDEKWGEAVTAVIEPKPGEEVDAEAVLAACRDRLGPVKTPKSVIVRGLPRSANGKVLKRQLRDEYWPDTERRV